MYKMKPFIYCTKTIKKETTTKQSHIKREAGVFQLVFWIRRYTKYLCIWWAKDTFQTRVQFITVSSNHCATVAAHVQRRLIFNSKCGQNKICFLFRFFYSLHIIKGDAAVKSKKLQRQMDTAGIQIKLTDSCNYAPIVRHIRNPYAGGTCLSYPCRWMGIQCIHPTYIVGNFKVFFYK